MIPHQRVASLLSTLLFLGLIPAVTAAPPIQATARAARTTVRVGEPVSITIEVRDCEQVPQIDPPSVEVATRCAAYLAGLTAKDLSERRLAFVQTTPCRATDRYHFCTE